MTTVLASHRQLAATLARMLELARANEWAQLPALDAQCCTLYHRLQEMDLPRPSRAEHASIVALAASIRADQDELTGLVRPQFVHLMRAIDALVPAARAG